MSKRIGLLMLMLSILLLSACAPAATATTTDNTTSVQSDGGSIIKLNLNTASGDDLLSAIPGFSNRMVREFQEYRPYVSIQQFRREIGKYVSDAQVADYEQYVYVPIAINDSDAATLLQIPGLDSTEADALISVRPYASTEDFLTKLSAFVSADELELAKAFLGE